MTLVILLLIYIVIGLNYEYHRQDVTLYPLVDSGGDKSSFPGRNEGLSRQYSTRQRVPPCLKAVAGIYLTKLSLSAGILLLLSGDISLNPGPSKNYAVEKCSVCLKQINKRQPRLPCKGCNQNIHLKCLGSDFEISGLCRLCCHLAESSGDESIDISDLCLFENLNKICKKRGMKIIHQNIQSLSAKIDQLRLLVRETKSGIHLLTLSETWVKRDASDGEFEIPGYKLFRKDRDGKNGGTAVFAREDIMVSRREDLELSSVEALWLEVSLPNSRGFLVGTFYRPDRTSKYYDHEFMTKLNNMLDLVLAQGKEVILTGDFNCCFMSNSRNNSDCNQLKSLCRYSDLKQLIAQPTRVTKDTISLIDLVATSCPQNISDSGVITSHLSDHELIYCIRRLNWLKAPSQIKTFRNYANYNPGDFCKDLESVQWNFVVIPDRHVAAVDQLWNAFKSSFVSVADRHAPIIQRRVRGIDNCPWLNKDIKLVMRQRDYFHSKARKTNHSEDWASYRCLRNRVSNATKKAKAAYK